MGGKASGIAQKLQAVLDARIGKGSIHNTVAAVQSHDRSIDFVGTAGIADPQTGAAMTPDTPYFIASVTKMYTAAVILRLYEQKRWRLYGICRPAFHPALAARPITRTRTIACLVQLSSRSPESRWR